MFEAIQASGFATWIRESPSILAYTLVLMLHGVGFGMVVGLNWFIGARLLGFVPKVPLSSLTKLWKAIWIGFTINLISGLGLFIADAVKFQHMAIFWVKMVFVFSSLALSVYVKRTYLDDPKAMAGEVAPAALRPLAWAVLAGWSLALVAGRLTGYPDMFNAWFGL